MPGPGRPPPPRPCMGRAWPKSIAALAALDQDFGAGSPDRDRRGLRRSLSPGRRHYRRWPSPTRLATGRRRRRSLCDLIDGFEEHGRTDWPAFEVHVQAISLLRTLGDGLTTVRADRGGRRPPRRERQAGRRDPLSSRPATGPQHLQRLHQPIDVRLGGEQGRGHPHAGSFATPSLATGRCRTGPAWSWPGRGSVVSLRGYYSAATATPA